MKAEADVRKLLLVYACCFAALWMTALAYVRIQSVVFHRGFPYDTILFPADSRFTDFTIFYPRLRVFGSPEAFYSPAEYPFTYPAPLVVCFVFFWLFMKEPLAAFVIFTCAFACLVAWAGLRSLKNHKRLRRIASIAMISAAVFSYPLLFLLDRANIEGIVWVAAAGGLFCFVRRHYYAAGLFIALAASMKIFPGLLLLLFVAKRRYRALAFSVFSGVAFSVGSLWLLGPSVSRALQGIQTGLNFLSYEQVLQFRFEIRFDHSLFAALKWIAMIYLGEIRQVNKVLHDLYMSYVLFAAVTFFAIYSLRLRKMPVLNQVLALTAISVTLPFVSYEYTLVHLIVPFLLLVFFLVSDVAAGRVVLERSGILALIIPFAFLFSPIHVMLAKGFGIGGQIKTIALVCLIGATLRVRLPSSLFDELPRSSQLIRGCE